MHFTSYWRGRTREPGIHCARMRQFCDAADVRVDGTAVQCDAADVTNLCRLCHESVPSSSKRVSEARNSLAMVSLCYQKKSPLPKSSQLSRFLAHAHTVDPKTGKERPGNEARLCMCVCACV